MHFPTIVKSKKKAKQSESKIFAITSEEYKKQQEEKMLKQIELQKIKELRKFEREMKKKIKKEELEAKKEEKLRLKKQALLQEQLIKEETEAKFIQLLKQKAAALDLGDYDSSMSASKKRKVMKDVTNFES